MKCPGARPAILPQAIDPIQVVSRRVSHEVSQ